MSAGTPALVAWLFGGTLLLILLFAVILTATGMKPDGHRTAASSPSCTTTCCTPSTPAPSAATTGTWRFLLTMLALTLGGLFIVSALIGVLATGIDSKLADLRRGRSIVLEKDHTVILGWSESIFTIICELHARPTRAARTRSS